MKENRSRINSRAYVLAKSLYAVIARDIHRAIEIGDADLDEIESFTPEWVASLLAGMDEPEDR